MWHTYFPKSLRDFTATSRCTKHAEERTHLREIMQVIDRKIQDLNIFFFECAYEKNNLFPVRFETNYLFLVLVKIYSE